jgi:hypothetical protein
VKIAIVATSSDECACEAPPLPLGYVAAWLEQQRHIVRIYDLALPVGGAAHELIENIRAFRPHALLIVSERQQQAASVQRELADLSASCLVVTADLRQTTPVQAAQVLAQLDQPALVGEQKVIADALAALSADLDDLPVPARHLLPIERYRLLSPSGALQTNLLIGQTIEGRAVLRNPRMIIAELRSLVHEHGIWHIVFQGLQINEDAAWLHDFLYSLMMARLGVSWEAHAGFDSLTPELLRTCRRAGCEGITIEFDAMKVLDSPSARQALGAAVREARALEMRVGGHVALAPRYSSIPALVDVSATFGLDDVRFSIQPDASGADVAVPALDLARSRYRALRSRQRLVERFGAYLGPMIWRVGRTGLLGRAWQRYSVGEPS